MAVLVMSLVDDFEEYFSSKYEAQRRTIENAERLTLSHMGQQVHVDVFTTGKVTVSGSRGQLRAEAEGLVKRLKAEPGFLKESGARLEKLTPQDAVLKIIDRELYEFLPEHDRTALLSAYEVLLSGLNLPDYSPVTMPIARVYEGFLARVLLRLGVCTQVHVQNPNFRFESVFDSAEVKSLKERVTTHAAELDGAKQRLKEFRHVNVHSQSSQFIRATTPADARRFCERVLNDMQTYYSYFRQYFVL